MLEEEQFKNNSFKANESKDYIISLYWTLKLEDKTASAIQNDIKIIIIGLINAHLCKLCHDFQ